MSSHGYFQKRDFSERKCTALRGGFNEPLLGAVSSRTMSSHSGKWRKKSWWDLVHIQESKGKEKTRVEWPITCSSIKERPGVRGRLGKGSKEAAAVDNLDTSWHRETVIMVITVWMVLPGLGPASGPVQWLLKGSKLRGEGKENTDLAGGCSREST